MEGDHRGKKADSHLRTRARTLAPSPARSSALFPRKKPQQATFSRTFYAHPRIRSGFPSFPRRNPVGFRAGKARCVARTETGLNGVVARDGGGVHLRSSRRSVLFPMVRHRSHRASHACSKTESCQALVT